ncbi:MAG: FIST C-terminal domain-containing protein [Betaproteobacteria bacterium]|nr:FIST C-terminal domain-containing protein [Betaproteobacteria bacterium]
MQISQIRWSEKSGWVNTPGLLIVADMVLVFADNAFFQTEACYAQLHEMFPQAHLIGCSSSGNVLGVEISDGDIVATAVKLNHSKVLLTSVDVEPGKNAQEVGMRLMAKLGGPELRHVIVLSDGLLVNGSELANGLNQAGIPATGGLAGDGERFGKTWVMADAPAKTGLIAALGFYGDVTIKSGCFAGCEEFGAERIITKSEGNVVYEIDGQPALDLYKRYLGEQAKDLPASGLRFPLSIQASTGNKAVIRTLLAVDEVTHSLTFAGDTPQGHLCKLMHANFDSLVDSAGLAAEAAQPASHNAAGLCLLVSCLGRRLVMGQITEDELDIVQEKLGAETFITGFYSYGELAPFSDVMQCQLHNQTMTLTTIYE